MKKRSLALLCCIAMIFGVFFASVTVIAAEDTETEGDATVETESGDAVDTEETVKTFSGDYNGDGELNTLDLICLRKYFASYNYITNTPPFAIPEGADADGYISLNDITDLRYFLTWIKIDQQPTMENKYTVVANEGVSYTWYVWEDGKLGEAVEGANTATISGATDGYYYVCAVSYTGFSLLTDPVLYFGDQNHPVCGETCNCDDAHENITMTPILTLDDFKSAMEKGGNYYLAYDVAVDKSVAVKADTVLCLNGKKLSRTGDGDFSILNVNEGASLSITDCSDEERIGYIDPVSGLWTEGEYTGEGTAIEYPLYGGVITGGYSSNGGAIFVNGTLNLYGVNFAGNKVESNNGGAIYVRGGKLSAMGDNVFVGNTAGGHGGAVYVTYVDKGPYGSSEMTGGIFAYNTAKAGGAVSIRSGCSASFNGTEFSINSVAGDDGEADGNAEGGGAIYVGFGSLALNDVTMIGNTAEVFGGAIDAVKATVTVTGGEFKNNTAVRGGAVNLIEGSTASFTGTKFTSNTATGEANYEGGGAINAEGGSLVLSTVVMDGNTSGYYGGAINARKGTVEIKDSVITNSTGNTGAALYFREAGTNVTITNSTVSDNNAKYNGAIYMTSAGTLTVNGLTANGNAADKGSVFYVSGGSINISDLIAENNTANNGGAFYVSGAKVTLNASSVKNNSGKLGGAIYVAAGIFTVTDTDISNNTASEFGGAIYAAGGTVNVNGASVKSNEADKGGAIYAATGSAVNVNGASFISNSARYGGAIYVEGATLNVNADAEGNKAVFESNIASVCGGAIYINEYKFTPEATESNPEPEAEIVEAKVSVIGAIFEGNTAEQGGAICVEKTEGIIISGSEFNRNTTGDSGGAIYMSTSGVTIVGGSFTENTANNGGAIYATSISTLVIENTVFESNSADNYGGAVDSVASTVTINGTDTLFKNNTAVTHGGAIYASYAKIDNETIYSILEMTDGRFEGNTAMAGGAVSIRTGCKATFTNTEFASNSVAGNNGTSDGNGEGGGAIYQGYGELVLNNVTMMNNTAEEFGGAISAVSGKVTVTGGEFKNNTAARGGAINAVEGCTMSFTGTKFIANSATRNNGSTDGGGAINADKGKLTLSGVTMDGNSSKYYGGAINARRGTVEITDSVIINSNGGTGAALYFRENGITVTITNSEVSNNTSSANGVIYMTSTGTLTINGLTANGNAANMGGVFYLSGGSININNLTAESNTANNGVALYVSGATVTLNASSVKHNSGKLGGAIYVAAGSLTVTDTDISNNTASEFGGAAYVTGGTLTLGEETVVSGNTAGNGGAIYAAGGTVNVNGASVKSNEADNGGAIYAATGSTVNVNGASFISNSARYGGAIYVEGATLNVNADAEGNKAVFESNIASGYGGAIYINEYVPEATESVPEPEAIEAAVSITGARFEGNTAEQGGAFYTAKSKYSITSSDFIGNSATAQTYGGGAIYSTNSKGTLDGITFVGNTSHKGGAVALHTTSEMTVSAMTATGNSATLNSENALGVGGVFFLNNSTLNLDAGENNIIYFGGTNAEDANTAYNGGAIYLESSAELNIVNAIFEGNIAANHGGAIDSVGSYVNISGEKTLFKNNIAAAHGGAIYSSYTSSLHTVINMTDGRFEGNSAKAGGAISARSYCETYITGTEFVQNKATSKENTEGGGAVYVNDNTLVLSGVTMDGNTSAYYGGALAAVGATVEIKDNCVIKNSKGATGGAIQLRNGGSCTITDLTLTDNTASGSGVVYMTSSGSKLTVSGVTATGNTTVNGGIFYVSGGDATITDVSITDKNGNNVKNMLYAGGAATIVTVNCATEEEKSLWQGATSISSATVNYVLASGN